jgi:hypothetical protein
VINTADVCILAAVKLTACAKDCIVTQLSEQEVNMHVEYVNITV